VARPTRAAPPPLRTSLPALSLSVPAARRGREGNGGGSEGKGQGGGGGMGKNNNSASGTSTPARASNQAMSIREETSGTTRVDEASLLRVKHLQSASVVGGRGGWGGPCRRAAGAPPRRERQGRRSTPWRRHFPLPEVRAAAY
jgi:hypothetical protein